MSRRNRNRSTRARPELTSREKFIAAMSKYLPALSALFVIAFSGGLMYPVTLGFVGLVPFAYGLYVSADKLYLKLQAKFESTAFAAANPKWKNTLFKAFMAISTLVVLGTLATMVYFAGPVLVGALLPLVSHAAVAWIASTQIFLAAAMLFSTLSFAVTNALCTDSIFSKIFKPSPYTQLKDSSNEHSQQTELSPGNKPKPVLQENSTAVDNQLTSSHQLDIRTRPKDIEQSHQHDKNNQRKNKLALPKSKVSSKEVLESKPNPRNTLDTSRQISRELRKKKPREEENNIFSAIQSSSNTRNLKLKSTKPKSTPNM